MSKSKGRRLAEWLRNLDSNSRSGAGGISPGSIGTAKLEDDAVTSAKIADSAVATAKLNDDAVTSAKIADSAVGTDHLANTGVTFGKLHTALVVTESDGIGNNDNDTTIATSAAIKDYVDSQVFTNEQVDDRVNSLLTAGTGITLTYDDAANTLTVAGAAQYGDSDVDSHLNQSNPTSGYILSWNGSDYAWVANSGGGLSNVVEDTTPQLGGNLDFNGNTATSFTSTGIDDNATSNAITINSSGDSTFSGQITQVTAGTGINASVHTGMGIKGSTPRLTMEPTADTQSSRIQFTNTAGTLWGSIFAYNDAERIQIAAGKVNFNTDKVAIGTTDAAYNLHIHEASSGGVWAMFSNDTTGSSAGSGALVGLDSAEEFNIRVYENKPIDFWTNNTQRMRITQGGNVGIRTTEPAKELQIDLASTTTTTLGAKGGLEFYSASSTVANGGEITWSSGSGNTELWCAISGHITTNTANGSVGDIVFAAKGADTTTTLAERMRVHGSGGGVSVSGASGDILTLVDTNLTASSSNIGNVRIAWDDSAGTRAAYVGSVNSDEFWINNQYSRVVLTYAGSRMFETRDYGAKLYGKLNITDSAYDNHIELNRSSEQWRISPSTDGSLDIRRIGGTGTATVDIHDRTYVGGAGSGLLQLNGASSGNEGGQLNIITAGSLGTYSIDTYQDDMRFLNGTTSGNYLWYKNSNSAIGMTLTGAGNLEVAGGLEVGGASIGSRSNSISVVGDDNSSTIASKTTSYDTVFSVLPWSSSITYLGTGTYYDDGSWIHASDNTTSSLLALAGSGVHWYASSGSTPNFDVASNVPLWNASGQWDGDINTTYDINTGSITAGGQITQTFSDTTGNSSSNAFTIDYNLAGNDTLTTDRTKTGLFVDLDSSSTGGDTSNEHRLYGIRADVRATGDSDLMYGIYGYAESQHSAGTISTVAGLYGVGIADETSSGRTTAAYGLLGIGYGYGSGSGAAGTLYGCYARGHATSAQDKNTTAIYGGYFEVEIDDPGQAQTCTNVYGLRSLMDDDSTGNVTGTGAYGLYINWGGTWSYTNKYHIYCGGNITSYFGGQIQAAGDVTAYYSDERLKIKKGKIENALEKVNSIETFYFTNNELAKSFGYRGDELQVGVSAQSVEKVMPEVIKVAPFDADAQGNSISGEDYKTVQYDKLVPLLIESIKELKAEIEELKKGR